MAREALATEAFYLVSGEATDGERISGFGGGEGADSDRCLLPHVGQRSREPERFLLRHVVDRAGRRKLSTKRWDQGAWSTTEGRLGLASI